MTERASRVVTVEIHGQRYPVRSSLEAAYVAELAAFVDAKMRAAAEQTPGGDSLKVAVLAALNIADDYYRVRTTEPAQPGRDLLGRLTALEGLVDRALAACAQLLSDEVR
jgi:cell division protein ZapA